MPPELSDSPAAAAPAATDAHRLCICPADSATDLQTFLDNHWKRGHVLARSRTLLDWQHRDPIHDRYNFVVARREGDGEIDALLGFIPTHQFDSALAAGRDLWLAIWKVRDGVTAAGLGLTLLSFLVRELAPRSISAIGLAPRVIPIYKFLGFTVGQLDHHYIVNRRRRHDRFALLGDFDGTHDSGAPALPQKRLTRCDAELPATLFRRDTLPAKSAAYVQSRYLRHPVYRYETYAIGDDAALVLRAASHAGACALRVVDYVGDPHALIGCRDALQALLEERDAEYMDFYCHGLPADVLHRAGFLRRRPGPGGGVIVPNYFEPFERRNVDLDFAYKLYGPTTPAAFTLFKGDSDQDRPSSVPAAAPGVAP